jgi:hypothetical protein
LQISHLTKILKRALSEKDVDSALVAYTELNRLSGSKNNTSNNGGRPPLNVAEVSGLIELLVTRDRAVDAASLAEDMLATRGTYPAPKIFRFLLNKLAAAGDVDAMNRLGQHLSPRVKKEVSFDNRLCNAYLAAGKAKEFVALLEKEVDMPNADLQVGIYYIKRSLSV